MTGTRWGQLWLAREAVLLALVPVLFVLRRAADRSSRRSVPKLAAGLGALALIWIEAIGSHAAAVESNRAAAVTADALHILSACLWLGALRVLVLMLWPQAPGGAGGPALVRACRRPLTSLIAGSVGIVLVTGLYSAGRQIGSVDDLLTTSYGRNLLVKSGLLAVLLGAGLVSATRLHGMRLPWVFAPARGQSPVQPAVEAPIASGTVADLVVSVSATPNRPGVNGFNVIAASTRRPAPAAIDSAELELTLGGKLSVIPLRGTGPDRYFGTARFDAPGAVLIDVVVHRAGQRLTVPVSWSVSAALPPQPAEGAASRPLAPYVNGLALLLIVAAVLAFFGFRLRRRPASPVPLDRATGRRRDLIGRR